MGKDQLLTLRGGESVFHQRQIKVFIPAVEFVANNGVAEVGEMDADLMFAAGMGQHAEKGEISFHAGETALDGKIRFRRRTVRADTVLNRDAAGGVASERLVNHALVRADVAVDDGEILL